MYSHKDKQKNELKKVTLNLDSSARQRLDDFTQRTKFSRGEVINKLINQQPLPHYVLEDDQQYLELTQQLTKINQSLGALSEDSDQTIQFILEGLQNGHIPNDKRYYDIIEQLRTIGPQLRDVNQSFSELQRANLFFLYGHRK